MKFLQFEEDEGVGILRIHRPAALNALNEALLKELDFFLDEHRERKILVITGSGEKAFVSGADVKEMQKMSLEGIAAFSRYGQEVIRKLEKGSMITIAAVNGYALGGGLELALGCDFIYAAEGAKLGLPETSLGLIPGFGGVQRLSAAVGKRMAKEMMMSAKILTAPEALEIGLINRVCESVVEEAVSTAKKILSHSFFASREIKEIIEKGFAAPDEQGFAAETRSFSTCFDTDIAKEKLAKFNR